MGRNGRLSHAFCRSIMLAMLDCRDFLRLSATAQLIDRAAAKGGSLYLTYHRWATKEQLTRCYPQFAQFLALKRRYDPHERFASDWYEHAKKLMS
jgi:FAD/FMN-containing dehydrogenase